MSESVGVTCAEKIITDAVHGDAQLSQAGGVAFVTSLAEVANVYEGAVAELCCEGFIKPCA